MEPVAKLDIGELAEDATYAAPTRTCDIVMKGGITSGVVYPLAVCELAKTYRFVNIGGTSAGAIAAAGTAAAEHGRTTGGAGFARIARLPEWIGTGTNLFSLFQPQDETKGLFRIVTAAIGPVRGRWWRISRAVAAELWQSALAGAAPGLLLALLAIVLDQIDLVWGLVSALLLLIIGVVTGTAWGGWRFARRSQRAVEANGFGICSGAGPSETARPQPLTFWLSDLIDDLAGKNPPGTPPGERKPLTFGDLWGPNGAPGERRVNLEMMTTNLTLGRPYRLPFETNAFYFHPAEFRKLFPKHVVDWMVANPRPRRNPESDPDEFAPLRPLPSAADLPVVVATRMSLSFPILLSAVPLYMIDYSRKSTGQSRVPERCWFSDGGIASNFPVHFFDRTLPRWPTFAINLRGFHRDFPRDPDERKNVYLPTRNVDGIVGWWRPIDSLPGFLGAIRNAMQNWLDNLQIQQPGYRDRVAHISLADDEGGLNLKMPPDVLVRLSERGRWSGTRLRERFDPAAESTSELTWDNHRWIRYRSAMAVIERMLASMRTGYAHHEPNQRTYAELVRRMDDELPTSYRWASPAQQAFAGTATDELIDLFARWEDQPERFEQGAPRPRPELRIVPRF